MNIDQWLLQVSQAYQSVGKQFSPDKKAFLLAELSENSVDILRGKFPNLTESQKETLSEVYDVMTRFFYNKASCSEAFGSLSRIKERFGSSLEENYGLSSGPFIDMAKTYWTYKLEVQDLFPQYHKCALAQILSEIETAIAGIFFPIPGPISLPVSRKEAQRQLLQEYAPKMDIDRFLSESPILKVSEGQKRSRIMGIFGNLLFFKPQWYKLLPDSVKPMDKGIIDRVEYFRKNHEFPHEAIFIGIIVSRWAVKRIQYYTLELIRKQMPNASENELWKQVLLSRFNVKLMSPEETDIFSKPLSQEEILSRIENIDNIISGFKSFDDVIAYIILMDEEENRFYDPSGIQDELNNLLET